MNTFTHLGISQTIQKIIEKELNVKLHNIGFMYGNIKPDISTALAKIPHYKDDSIEFIKKEISELMLMKICNTCKCSKAFSEKLGVIIHFLSDYFCHAHSNNFKGNMMEHHIYEAKVSQYFKSYNSIVNNFGILNNIEVIIDCNRLFNYIDEHYDIYSAEAVSPKSDMMYTMKISLSVSLSIIVACLNNGVMTAA